VADQKRKGFSADALISLVLFAAVAGHVGGFWQIPRWDAALQIVPLTSVDDFDPHSVTITYLRGGEGGESTWDREQVIRIMTRFTERWAEATLGRSKVTIVETAEPRDAVVLFMPYRVIPDTDALHMSLPQAGASGGKVRILQVFANQLRPDTEYTANVVLHELAHALGCCRGPGSVDGHWVPCRQQIMCASGLGTATRTFNDAELAEMGLGR
jgi:hypothetical protein